MTFIMKLASGTFKDGGLALMGVFTPMETMKYVTSNDCLIDKGMEYFEAEAINTNVIETLEDNILQKINI